MIQWLDETSAAVEDLGGAMAVPLGSSEEVLRPSLKRFSEAAELVQVPFGWSESTEMEGSETRKA